MSESNAPTCPGCFVRLSEEHRPACSWLREHWPVDTENVAVISVAAALSTLGFRIEDEDLRLTPQRWVRAMKELTRGYGEDPAEILGTTFDSSGYDQLVLLKDIAFASLCEHHVLPFTGKAHVAYLPGKRVVGLSKLARVVDVFARRFQIQERMTKQIADALETALSPLGVAVMIEASHSCMAIRGVTKAGATMTTSDVRGAFRDSASARAEFFALVKE